ncbi:hypothetical protein GSI_15433 [Ganoderma sinense ZZ0214-1]|uniref:Tyrosinase C-terminal domain-containing protein n=1 Tax=Ganoderma sinense ZZ0214-1 TaxID=1077348 RepID=A0A2G8RML0_9APHY|nr:hypothetical protein GSI_15433 [Ganoderma sinense ZZ0214-1]
MNNRDAVLRQADRAATDATATTGVPTTYTWLWSTRVRVKESEVGRSFQVLIFLGSVPENPREWIRATSYVGSVSAFVSGTAGQRGGESYGQVQTDAVTEGYVHLNPALAKNVGRTDPNNVRPYLKDNLDWRIQLADGTPIPLERLPSLEVVVVAVQLEMRDGELPIPVGEPVLHRDITSGRLGGARPE